MIVTSAALKLALSRLRDERRRRVRAEADAADYRKRWIDAVNYVQRISHKPMLGVVNEPPPEKVQAEPARQSRAEIEAKYAEEDELAAEEYQRQTTAPNDIDLTENLS